MIKGNSKKEIIQKKNNNSISKMEFNLNDENVLNSKDNAYRIIKWLTHRNDVCLATDLQSTLSMDLNPARFSSKDRSVLSHKTGSGMSPFTFYFGQFQNRRSTGLPGNEIAHRIPEVINSVIKALLNSTARFQQPRSIALYCSDSQPVVSALSCLRSERRT